MSHNLEDQQMTNDGVPVLIDKCISFISTYGKKLFYCYCTDGTRALVSFAPQRGKAKNDRFIVFAS